MASQLERWLATASKSTLAVSAISIGILFIVLADPPATLCDTQLEFFKKQQAGVLFTHDKNLAAQQKVPFTKMMEYCKKAHGPGACYEVFVQVRKAVRDLQEIPVECSDQVAGISEIQKMLWTTTEFMVTTAWGTQPPKSYLDRMGWLDAADLSLFCHLKNQIIQIYGVASWDRFRERMFLELPEAKGMSRQDIWQKSILSEDCGKF